MQLSIRFTLCVLAGAVLGLALGLATGDAEAQSLSPMRHQGVTPSEIKGFRLEVGNPYSTRMRFALIAMDPSFTREVGDASVTPAELILAPGVRRTIILAFRIPASQMERTIGLCVVPTNIEGPVQPRVCGTYTGTLLTR